MADRIRSNIEFYDGRQAGKRVFWRLSAVLYHANSGGPDKFLPELEAMVADAQSALKASGVRYWYNGVRFAGMLVARSVEGEHKMPRLLPCTELLSTSDYVYRVSLAPEEQVKLTCYRVVHGDGGLTESLSPVDEQKPAS